MKKPEKLMEIEKRWGVSLIYDEQVGNPSYFIDWTDAMKQHKTREKTGNASKEELYGYLVDEVGREFFLGYCSFMIADKTIFKERFELDDSLDLHSQKVLKHLRLLLSATTMKNSFIAIFEQKNLLREEEKDDISLNSLVPGYRLKKAFHPEKTRKELMESLKNLEENVEKTLKENNKMLELFRETGNFLFEEKMELVESQKNGVGK